MLNYIKLVLLSTLLTSLCFHNALAACSGASPTWNATDCTNTEISACIAGAKSGDTIKVPAGSCTWTGAVTIPEGKTIKLMGAGSDRTIISRAGNFLSMGSNGSRFSGFRLNAPARSSAFNFIEVKGAGWRIDHNIIDNSNTYATYGYGGTAILAYGSSLSTLPYGLIDNNTILEAGLGAIGYGASAQYLQRQNNGWAIPLTLGDENSVYIEDNIIAKHTGNPIDANYGGKYVFRYNNVDTPNTLVHGVQGINRGGRSWEVYGNAFNNTLNVNLLTELRARGGTGVMFYNKLSGNQQTTSIIQIDNNRSCTSTCDGACAAGGPGMCNGASYWDGNSDATGYPCRDQIGRSTDSSLWNLYALATCSDNGSGKVRLGITGHDLNMSDKAMIISGGSLSGCGTGIVGLHTILAVGTDTVDIDLTYTGAKTGSGIVVGPPPSQALQPAYQWNNRNTVSNTPVQFTVANYCAEMAANHIKSDRDYYNYTDSFNGTTGTGCGPLASRPATCTTGVGYWATDQSCTDLEGMVGKQPRTPISGTLYKCMAPNAWTKYYTPYPYPHLLTRPAPPISPKISK